MVVVAGCGKCPAHKWWSMVERLALERFVLAGGPALATWLGTVLIDMGKEGQEATQALLSGDPARRFLALTRASILLSRTDKASLALDITLPLLRSYLDNLRFRSAAALSGTIEVPATFHPAVLFGAVASARLFVER